MLTAHFGAEPNPMVITKRYLLCLFALTAGTAVGQDGDYAKQIASTVNACSIVCLDELNLEVFGTLVIPFERPSVEYCGVRASMTDAERAQEDKETRSSAEREAIEKKYSAKERQALRMKVTEKARKCDADFKRHCEETRAKYKLEERKSAVEKARKAINDTGVAARTAAITKYLNNLLEKCPLDQ